jgi:hypothetical protein
MRERPSRMSRPEGAYPGYPLHTTGRVFVTNNGARQALWVGSNHGGAIVKVEPLD